MVVSAVIGGVAAVAGGAVAAKGAKDAAKTQAGAAEKAAGIGAANAQLAADVRNKHIFDSVGHQTAGLADSTRINNDTIGAASAAQTQAIGESTDQLVGAATQAQQIYEQALRSGSQTQIDTAKQVMDTKVKAAQAASAAVTSGRNQASAQFQATADRANTSLKEMYTKNAAMYDPYLTAGSTASAQLTEGTKAGGDFNRNFTAADFTKDGGYDFRMKEGLTAVENSAAARGGLLSGDNLKATTEYGQGFASNEYDKAYGRFTNDMDSRFARLSSLADRGLSATGSVTNLGAQYSRDAAGNTMAAGKYGADNTSANGQTVGNMLNQVGGYTADGQQTIGNVTANEQMNLGTSRADLTTNVGTINADRTLDLGNVKTAAINATGANNSAFATGNAAIHSGGTLAIGASTADGINGVNTATVNGINDAANARSAGQAATGQIYNNTLNRAANNFTTFYSMNKKGGKA